LFASLTPGVTAETAITTARPNKNWSINLVAGQAVYIGAGETTPSALQPLLILIGPNRKTVGRSIGNSGAFMGKVAPLTGTYTVRIRDTAGTQTGGVRVTAVFTGSTPITDGDDAGVAASGRRFPASIAPGDLDVWRINATNVRQFLSLVLNENNNGSAIGVGVALIGPDGSGLTGSESTTGFALDVPAARRGTYYAVVYEPGSDASGRYGFSLGLSPGTQTNEDPDTRTPLSSGQNRTGDIPSGDIDLYPVSLAAGRTIRITMSRNNSSVTPEILIIDPNGNQVASASGTSSASLTYTTRQSGTFAVLTRNRDANTGGGYRLSYSVS
jgi:hypothetical protein